MLKDIYKPESLNYEGIYNCIKRDWIANAARTGAKKFVIGISGGKDSSVVAALAVKIFGKENVLGVLMPNGEQSDISDSYNVVKFLDIQHIEINIAEAVNAINSGVADTLNKVSCQTEINLPARIRMATLYAVAQTWGGRVINTCSLSEDYIGYSTLFGDDCGSFSPLGQLTCTEIKYLGTYLGLPKALCFKTPSDGLCGISDEEKIGFSYFDLDKFIRTGEGDEIIIKKIEELHYKNLFKMELVQLPTVKIPKELLGK